MNYEYQDRSEYGQMYYGSDLKTEALRDPKHHRHDRHNRKQGVESQGRCAKQALIFVEPAYGQKDNAQLSDQKRPAA